MNNDLNINNYQQYFNIPDVIDTADKLFDIVKNGNELLKDIKLNDDEKTASMLLACKKLQEYYNNK